MALESLRQLAYDLRDELHAAFIAACEVVTLNRIRLHGGGVIKLDLIAGTAWLEGRVELPELLKRMRDHLSLMSGPFNTAEEVRVRADLSFEKQKRSCVVAGARSASITSREFVVCRINGKSIVRVGKWHVWSAEPWDEWIEWPVVSEELRVAGA
jgi:hypothetical protein